MANQLEEAGQAADWLHAKRNDAMSVRHRNMSGRIYEGNAVKTVPLPPS